MMNIVVCGEIMILLCSLSKYLVSPAPDDGRLILLSLLMKEENDLKFKNVVEDECFLKKFSSATS
jgi:hypothetical protein